MAEDRLSQLGDVRKAGERGPVGPPGPAGPMPDHRWQGAALQFEKPDGDWGEAVNLRGPAGRNGSNGASAAAQPTTNYMPGGDNPVSKLTYEEDKATSAIVAFVNDDSDGLMLQKRRAFESMITLVKRGIAVGDRPAQDSDMLNALQLIDQRLCEHDERQCNGYQRWRVALLRWSAASSERVLGPVLRKVNAERRSIEFVPGND